MFAPDVAVLLNVAEDHLDWHGSPEAYAEAKSRVFLHQGEHAVAVVNADDPVADRIGRARRAALPGTPRRSHRPTGTACAVSCSSVPTARSPRCPRRTRRTHRANALAAAIVAQAMGADRDGIATALAEFDGLPHRVQLVGERAGVRFYDDSKATNPHATVGALRGFDSAAPIPKAFESVIESGKRE